MPTYMNQTPPVRMAIITGGVVALIFAMHAMADVIAPFLLSVLFAVFVWTLLEWLKRRGLPGWAAILVTGMGMLLAGAILTIIVDDTLDRLSKSLPALEQQLSAELAALDQFLQPLSGGRVHVQQLAQRPEVSPMNVIEFVITALSALLSNSFLMLFYVVFMVLEATTFQGKLNVAFRDNPSAAGYSGKVTKNLRSYIVVETLLSVLVGVLVAVALWILKIDYAAIWGVLAFFLNFIPNFGPILAAVPAVIMAFMQYGPSVRVLLVIGAYALIIVVVGSILFPRLMGRSVGLSSLVVLVSLIFWGWVLGPIGLILSVPIMATVKIFLDAYVHSRWLAVLLGGSE